MAKIYQPSHEATELTLYANNDYNIYQVIQLVVTNLAKKYAKGVFVREKAIQAFYNVANQAAKSYCLRFGSWSDKYYTMFSVSDRYTCAADLLDNYIDEIMEESKHYATH